MLFLVSHLNCCSGIKNSIRMSATKQKVSNMLMDPVLINATSSSSGAMLLIRKIIPISIASILFKRIDMDKDDFRTLERNGIPYHVFRDKSKDRLIIDIRKWITGILDALDKNYLKEIYLLLSNIRDDTEVKESYKFKITYFKNDEKSVEPTAAKKEILELTDSLLGSINSLDSFTKFKKGEVSPHIALTYYHDVTPLEYEPPYFGGRDERVTTIMHNAIANENKFYYLGALKTMCCRIKCRGNGQLLTVLDKTISEYTSAADTSKDIFIQEANLDNTDKENNADSTINLKDKCIEIEDDDTHVFQCPCTINDKFQNIEMVDCSGCGTLLHVPCIGYLRLSTIPNTITCDSCNDNNFPSPHEMFLRQTTCIYRLASAYAYLNKEVPDKIFGRLHSKIAGIVTNKLLEKNSITATNSGYILNTKNLEMNIKSLFPQDPIVFGPDSNNLIDVTNTDDDSNSFTLSKKTRVE